MGSIERVMEEADDLQDDEELEEGPPPGFHCIQSSPIVQQELESVEQDDAQDDDDDDDDDEIKGPPPGFSTPPALSLDACMEAEENAMDEGNPPSGWYSKCTPEPPTPPKTPLVTAISSGKLSDKLCRRQIYMPEDGAISAFSM